MPGDDNRYLLRLEADDWELLLTVSAAQKLKKSDVLRRALRAYAPEALQEAKRTQEAQETLRALSSDDDEQVPA